MLRAITAVSRHLGATYDWQQLKFDHSFRSVNGSIQPGALPADFLRFIEGTFVDRTRKIQFCRGQLSSEWAQTSMWGYVQQPWQWRQQGSDLHMMPSSLEGSEIAFSYISKAIGNTTTIVPEVIYTTNQMLLKPGNRYVVGQDHSLGIPTLRPGEFIELVPIAGWWSRLGAQLIFQDESPLLSTEMPDTKDIITIARRAGGHHLLAAFGQFTPYLELSINGQTLEAGKRYIVDTGQQLYVPVLRKGEWIELTPKNLSWHSTQTRLITRDGLTINDTKTDWRDGIVSIKPDMASATNYVISGEPIPASDRPPQRMITAFSSDTDESMWDEELMILGTIWRINWRDGQPYNEDFRNFERMAYDRCKGEGHQGIISQRSQNRDPIAARLRGMRNAAIVISDPTTWETPR
jgi:hypothetical protein